MTFCCEALLDAAATAKHQNSRGHSPMIYYKPTAKLDSETEALVLKVETVVLFTSHITDS